jgi:excisionase family DNA binding protein
MTPHPSNGHGPLGAEVQSNGGLSLGVPPELVELIAGRVAELVAERLPDRPEPWLDADAAAEYLAAPRSRVYELVERGRLCPHRDGRRLLFRRADLDAALNAPEESR